MKAYLIPGSGEGFKNRVITLGGFENVQKFGYEPGILSNNKGSIGLSMTDRVKAQISEKRTKTRFMAFHLSDVIALVWRPRPS